MQAYLDNSATTRCSERAKDLMVKVLMEDYGNPSSLHTMGVVAERYIKEAKERIAKTLKADEKEILFTSGGTESNNMALIGTALANKRAGNHIITTSIEHASVLSPLAYLEEQGFRVTYLTVDENGQISLDELRDAVCEDTILVSMMMVNNEIGAVEPIAEAAKIVKEKNPNTIIHVDAIQAYGKKKIAPAKLKIDLLSVSGHKIHGPKGTGFLYVADGVKMHPIIHGGGQQNGRRSGTQNVPGIAGLGLAAKKMYEDHLAKVSQMYECKAHLIQKLEEIDKVAVHAVTPELRECAPHVVSASFEGVGSEVLLHALEDRGIYVSSGSACSSNHPGISSTLQAIGVPDKLLESTIRFSFSVYTTIEELDYTVEQLKELLPVLRRYVRR